MRKHFSNLFYIRQEFTQKFDSQLDADAEKEAQKMLAR